MDYKNKGILYCCIGEPYYRLAQQSFQSYKEHNPSVCASVYSDQSGDEKRWDHIIPAQKRESINRNNEMVYKLDTILSTPYSSTIYLDADTYIIDFIEDIFELLNKFDLVLCHGHDRNKRYNLIRQATDAKGNRLFSTDIPYAFAPIQGGLIAYNRLPTLPFFESVKKMYLEKGYFDDQAIIRELLWKSDLRFYILPPEYNFNSVDFLKKLKKLRYRSAIPKIFHFTQNKEDNIGRIVAGNFNKNRTNDWLKQSKPSIIIRIFRFLKRRFN